MTLNQYIAELQRIVDLQPSLGDRHIETDKKVQVIKIMTSDPTCTAEVRVPLVDY